jgi:hypothetical protein
VFRDAIIHARRERSTTGVLRIVIVIAAGFLIWQFSDGFLSGWETQAEPTEARWFNVLSALGEGLLGPLLAVSANCIVCN